ncbi:Hypothetical predicted protein, partial [Paramuricea clavata]
KPCFKSKNLKRRCSKNGHDIISNCLCQYENDTCVDFLNVKNYPEPPNLFRHRKTCGLAIKPAGTQFTSTIDLAIHRTRRICSRLDALIRRTYLVTTKTN